MWRLLSIDVMGLKLPCPFTLANALTQKVIGYMNVLTITLQLAMSTVNLCILTHF